MNKDSNASHSPKVHPEIREIPRSLGNTPDPVQNENVGFSPGREVGLPFSWACQCWVDKDSSALRHIWGQDQGEQEPLFCHHTNSLGPASPGLGKAATFYDVLSTHIHVRLPLGVEGKEGGYSLRKPGLRVIVISRWRPRGKDCPGPGCQWAE